MILHIGLSKAGSTTLQKSLFMRHTDISYLGSFPIHELSKPDKCLNHSVQKEAGDRLSALLFKTDSLSYKEEEARSLLEKIMGAHNSHGVLLYSDESALGTLHSYPDVSVKLERLRALFSAPKVLVIIREQKSILRSFYRMFPFDPRFSYTGRNVSFREWYEIERDKKYFSYLNVIDYRQLMNRCIDLFGESNVLTLPLEMLTKDSKEFSRRLSSFCGINFQQTYDLLLEKPIHNKGVSSKYNWYRRIRRAIPIRLNVGAHVPNKVRTALLRWLHKGKSQVVNIPPDISSQIDKRFAHSNRYMSEKFNLSLEKYDYSI